MVWKELLQTVCKRRKLLLVTCGTALIILCYHYISTDAYLPSYRKKGKQIWGRKMLVAERTIQTRKTPNIYTSSQAATKLTLAPKTSISKPKSRLDSVDRALNLSSILNHTISSRNESEKTFFFAQRRDYSFIISHNDTCGPLTHRRMTIRNSISTTGSPYLLIAIRSTCGLIKRREAIRNTWGNETWCWNRYGIKIKVLFLLGACEYVESKIDIFREDQANSDIFQWDFFDSLRNLTLKDHLFFRWFVTHCRDTPYIFKGDDDILVNIRNMVSALKLVPTNLAKDLYVGSRLSNSPRIVSPKSKYFVSSNLFWEKYYPPYLSGGGFILSGHLALKFYLASLKTPMIPMDDAYLGILAKILGVNPINDMTFKSWGLKVVDPCRLAKIKTFHRVPPEHMIKIWKIMISINLTDCDKTSDDVYGRLN